MTAIIFDYENILPKPQWRDVPARCDCHRPDGNLCDCGGTGIINGVIQKCLCNGDGLSPGVCEFD